MNTTSKAFVAMTLSATLMGAAGAADVETLLGRATPRGGTSVQNILVTATPVDKVQGRAPQIAVKTATPRFAVNPRNAAVAKRQGRA